MQGNRYSKCTMAQHGTRKKTRHVRKGKGKWEEHVLRYAHTIQRMMEKRQAMWGGVFGTCTR